MEWGCMQALIDFDGWRKWKDFSQNSPISTKSSKLSLTTPASSAPAATVTAKAHSGSNSDSTDSGDMIQSKRTNPPPPDTLAALSSQTESADTLNSISTTDSIPEPVGPVSSTVTLTPGTFQRQTSSQPTKHLGAHSGPRSTGNSPQSSTKNLIQQKSASQNQDDRRRKRTSLGRSGLSGVVEEFEDGREVGVGA
jgi:hypothetical protein